MSHRQGLHSDDRPYPGEELCYCDEATPNTDSKDALGEILNEFATDTESDLDTKIIYTLQQINSLMISRKEVEEAIPKGTPHCEDLSIAWCSDCLKQWHDELRAKLNLKPLQEK